MSRYVQAPIIVLTVNGWPNGFQWKKIWHEVRAIKDFWREVGAWWDGETEKDVFLVIDDRGGFYEIFHDRVTEGWLVNRVMD